MAGLKGLGPRVAIEEKPATISEAQRAFIEAAPLRHGSVEEPAGKPSRRRFVRKHFSIDEEVERLVEEAALLPRTFRVTSSGALRAAVRAFAALPEEQALAYLQAEVENSKQ